LIGKFVQKDETELVPFINLLIQPFIIQPLLFLIKDSLKVIYFFLFNIP